MERVGQPLRLHSTGGRRTGEAALRRQGAATAVAVAALIAALAVAVGCETVPGTAPRASTAALARENVTAGLDLYESGEFVLAARRFHTASTQASSIRDRALEKKSVTGECTAWLRARRLGELSECTERLERLQRRERRSEPGVNTLIALGAIAGQRPLPSLRIPNTVQPLFRQAADQRTADGRAAKESP
jgi:hypothetical protein